MPIDRAALSPNQLAMWPSVSQEGLAPDVQVRFRQRCLAIELLSNGERITAIEGKTGVVRSQLYCLIQKAMSPHPDGRMYGYRALLPYTRVKRYHRESPVKRSSRKSKGGATGAMTNLLARYPELEIFLIKEIAKMPLLFSSGKNGQLIVRGLRNIHRAFIAQCRRLGLYDTDYPLNQDQKGIRSLSKVIKKLGAKTFWQAAKKSGAAHDKGRWNDQADNALQRVTRPYQVVELDGHLLDIRLSITYTDPFGYEQTLEMSRIWVLAIVDIYTRVIIGYHLALAAEYNRHDVIRAIQNAVEPHRPMTFTVPGMGYGSMGGFPSQLLPELSYAVWDELRFDNAKAHLAEDTLHTLRDELGCVAHAGPAGDPDRRPFIERFFKTLSSTMSHRLPATTLSNPEELRRLINASNPRLAITMPLAELEQLIEAVLASLNATPHESLGGRSPLQALQFWVRDQSVPLRRLPESMRDNLQLLRITHTSRVRGNIARGVRPYVSFFGVRYSNQKLAERTELIGKPITVIYCPDDIRTLRTTEANGAEIGILTVTRAWNQAAHSLQMRQHILKLTRDGKLQMDAEMDPVQAYLHYLRQQAPRRRKSATKLEASRRIIDHPTTTESPLKTQTNDQKLGNKAINTKSPALESEESVSAKPRRLSIPPGFSR